MYYIQLWDWRSFVVYKKSTSALYRGTVTALYKYVKIFVKVCSCSAQEKQKEMFLFLTPRPCYGI